MFLRINTIRISTQNVRDIRYISRTLSMLNVENTRTELSLFSKKHLKEKSSELVQWYGELTGLDEVRDMQNRVIAAQNSFAEAQNQRREVNKQLNKVHHKLKEISSELVTTSRGENRYLQLITQEHEILKEERRLNTDFALLEREERDHFALLTSYVKESHEKERERSERTKYLYFIGSIICTILGFAASSVNNHFKMTELRKLVKESSLKTQPYDENMLSILLDLKGILASFKGDGINIKSQAAINDELKYLNKEQERSNKFVKQIDTTLQELKIMLHPNGFGYLAMGIGLSIIIVPCIMALFR